MKLYFYFYFHDNFGGALSLFRTFLFFENPFVVSVIQRSPDCIDLSVVFFKLRWLCVFIIFLPPPPELTNLKLPLWDQATSGPATDSLRLVLANQSSRRPSFPASPPTPAAPTAAGAVPHPGGPAAAPRATAVQLGDQGAGQGLGRSSAPGEGRVRRGGGVARRLLRKHAAPPPPPSLTKPEPF